MLIAISPPSFNRVANSSSLFFSKIHVLPLAELSW
jgi:hypothetical protein